MIVLHVAPHPDDETLGCGGSLLRHVAAGDAVHWLVLTEPAEAAGGGASLLDRVAAAYGFAGVHRLRFPDARLDTVALADLVAGIGAVVRAVKPELVFLPFPGDAHSDHRVAFEAAAACTKWFRYSAVRRVLAYETLSETEFGLDPTVRAFRPNVYVDIGAHLSRKLEILKLYPPDEIGPHPFPRSIESARALATLRGAAAGLEAAEAFMLLKQIC